MTKLSSKLTAVGLVAAMAMLGGVADAASIKGKKITLRMGSGHPPFITYVKEMSKYFAPRVVARVAKETDYTIKFREHYSGTVVNVFDTLEGVQDGRLDIGGWCVCFDDDKAMPMNLGYYVPFSHPNAIVASKIYRRVLTEFPALAEDYEKRYKQKLLAISGFNNYGLLTAFDWKRLLPAAISIQRNQWPSPPKPSVDPRTDSSTMPSLRRFTRWLPSGAPH